jgi:hypothetical protein
MSHASRAESLCIAAPLAVHAPRQQTQQQTQRQTQTQTQTGTDFANYFCTYAYLYHQKDMLEDHKRTGAYYNAIVQNRKQFHGKVRCKGGGCGSGGWRAA